MSQINVNKVTSPDQAQVSGPSIDIASNSNITIDTDTVFVDSTNNRLGIGTSSPQRTLDIQESGGASFDAGLLKDICNITGSGLASSNNHDVSTANFYYWDGSASSNWTYNIRYDSSNTLNSKMSTGEFIHVAYLTGVGSSGYYHSTFQIDGTTVTPQWTLGTAPNRAGSPSGVDGELDAGATAGYDIYSFQIHKTGDAAFIVLGSQAHFGPFS